MCWNVIGMQAEGTKLHWREVMVVVMAEDGEILFSKKKKRNVVL
jgi:hypothetical protein